MRKGSGPKLQLSVSLPLFFSTSVWVPLYLGFLGLCSAITFGCILFLRWKKKLEGRAREWMEMVRAAAFTYTPLLYWRNKGQQHGMKRDINTGPPPADSPSAIQVEIPDCLWEPDTYKDRHHDIRGSNAKAEAPVPLHPALVAPQQPLSHPRPQRHTTSPFPINFQDLTFAPPFHLLNLPPMLDHSASYPCLKWKQKGMSTSIPFPL